MNMKTQTANVRPGTGATPGLAFGRVKTVFLIVAILAALGIATTTRADRVGHDVSAGNVTVVNTNILPVLPTDWGTILSVPVAVNGFAISNNYNISDHRIVIQGNPADDVGLGVLISAVSQNMRNNRGSNMTHTVSASPIPTPTNGIVGLQYEVATQGEPLVNNDAITSPEDNVNFASAWFPYATWFGGYAFNINNTNGGLMNSLIGSPGLVLGTHVIDWKSISNLNGRAYLDLRSFGIDSRRDGVLLVNHAKNEANYASSMVNDSEDGTPWDGTWTIQVRDNRSGSLEQDPFVFVFVPKSNTNVVSGMIMADASIPMFSGNAPAFTVTKRDDIAGGTYELKIPGRSPTDGVLIISSGCGGPYNGDNIVTYEPNTAGDGWLIQTRDLPACGVQNMDPTDVVCTFAFIPAEKPGVTVTPNKNLLTTEAGGTAQFTVRVNGYPKPTADVTINLSSSDTGEGTVAPSTLTFTPAEWDVPKTVTITGVDDGDVDGSQAYTINLSSTTSTDPGFNGLVPGNVGAINIDNEAGVALDKTSITTTEAGGTDTFSVWLTVAPTADVTLALSSSDTTEATVSPGSLTFTPANYATPQVVTVTGVDDFVQDGTIAYTIITGPASSTDGNYNNFNALDVAGQNVDNDLAKVIVPASKFTVTEPNTTVNIPLVLNSQPTANVTINCVSSDTTEGTVTPSVTFTPANWSTPQNVTVTAADDLVNDGTVAWSIITSVTSTDPVYAAIDPDDVTMETVDNEADFALPSGALTYGAGEPATGIDSYATVSDLDTADYNGGGLTVTITAGGSSNDRLDVRNTGTDPGQIGVSGSTISYGGVTIGTKSGGTGTTPLAITFTSTAATPEAAQALARSVTYRNVDAKAAPQTRTLSFVLADGDGGVSTVTKTINIRLLRIYSFQQGADGGFGLYTNALDTQIHPDFPNTPYPAGYSANGLWIDYNPLAVLPTDQMQCFLKFTDLFGTGPGQIPAGAKIVFAELTMNVADSGHGARFNRMLGDWDETITFTSVGDGIALDDVEAVSGTNAFLGDQAHNTTSGTGLRTIGVTSDVQAWANGTNNYGWVMSTWEGGENGTAFSPCETTNVVLRPRLRVGWLPPSESVASFQQGTNGYTGTVDTQVRLVAPDTSFAANTTLSPDPLVSATPIPNPNHVLIRFDNIIGLGADQVPPGATIHAAILEVTSINADAQGAGGQFHRLLKTWNATDTWNIWVNGVSPDGVEAAVSPTVTLPTEGFGVTVQPTKHNIELTADVQAWASGTAANYGWVILPWDEGSNGWAFNSAEAALTGSQPLLRVYFTFNRIVLKTPIVSPGSVQLPFTAQADGQYYMLRAPDITGPWTTNGSATVVGGTATYTDHSPLAERAFYRVQQQ
jgi:hypothetical protein